MVLQQIEWQGLTDGMKRLRLPRYRPSSDTIVTLNSASGSAGSMRVNVNKREQSSTAVIVRPSTACIN